MENYKLTPDRKKKIKTLIKNMNKQNERDFPVILPLIESFNIVVTDDELDFLLLLGTKTYKLNEISSTGNLPAAKFNALFETLKAKGFIRVEYDDNDEELYDLNAIIVGWYEAQVHYLKDKPEEKEFAKKFQGEFVEYMKRFNFFPLRNVINPVIRLMFKSNMTVGLNISPKKFEGKNKISVGRPAGTGDSMIYPMKTVNDLIIEYGKKNEIAQFKCMCRRLNEQNDDNCRLKMPDNCGCLGFGNIIRPYVKYGAARKISLEEALDSIQIAREHGALHSVYHIRDDVSKPEMGICNCCWDCCSMLRGYNQGSLPVMYKSYFYALFTNESGCTGCGKCAKFCPTAAIKLKGKGKNKKAVLEVKKCIGCGQCVYQCPQNILDLAQKERDVFLPIIKKSEARIQC